jgi:hypothetical protein
MSVVDSLEKRYGGRWTAVKFLRTEPSPEVPPRDRPPCDK